MGISTSELRRLEALCSESVSPLESGRPGRVGKYLVTERMGGGGGGHVWKAFDTQLGRWVALKFLKSGGMEERTRFWREAQLAAKLTHPNIAAVYEATPEYIAMQLVEGTTLDAVPRADVRARVELLRQAALAVQYAHEHGVLHRDLKPGNIMVDAAGRQAYVLDFGLARQMQVGASITATGVVMGTPPYMSPEQARGLAIGVRGDVYSLGATLYEILAGRPPFASKDAYEVLRQVVEEEPEAPAGQDTALRAIVMKAMSKEPLARHATAAAFAEDLRRWLAGEPVSARAGTLGQSARRWARRHPVGLALGALAAVSAVVLAVQAVRARAELRAQESRLRREQEGLARISALWSAITERKRDLRAGRLAPQRAAADLRAALGEVDRSAASGVAVPQARFVRARGRLYLDDRRGAEEDVRAVLASMPECGPAWAMLGMILLEDHREGLYGAPSGLERRKRRMAPVMEQVLEAFRRAGPPPRGWGLTPVREDEVLTTLASACGRYYVERDEAGARASLTAAMSEYQSEEYAEVLASWATMEDSVEWYRRAIRLAPGYAKAHADLGAALAQLGDAAGARAALDEALRLEPSHVAAMANRGNVRADLSDRGALEDFDRAIALRPDQPALYAMRGKGRLRLEGDLDGAALDFQRSLALDEEGAEAHAGLGLVAAARGDLRAAVERFNRAIELHPSYTEVFVNRAHVKVGLGDLSGARADCDKAVELEPGNPAPYLNRGSIRLTQGDAAGAVEDLERALKLAPVSWPHRAKAEQLLRRARGR